MGCYHPTPAYQKGPGLPVEFWPRAHLPNLGIPCGSCIGCLSTRAMQWAQRCSHEATYYDHNIFLTLTYDDEQLPINEHLDPRALALFIKRLRKTRSTPRSSITTNRQYPCRYFACGEYGESNGRPHYHLLLFNCELADKYRVGQDLYSSDTLSTLWPHGLSKYGPATPGAANYIAHYTLNKRRTRRTHWFSDTDGYADHNGEWIPRPQPFLRISNRPALGTRWLHDYQTDLRHGYLLENNHKHTIPRTYKRKLEDTNPQLYAELQANIDRDRALHKQTTEYQLRAGEIIHRCLKRLTASRSL